MEQALTLQFSNIHSQDVLRKTFSASHDFSEVTFKLKLNGVNGIMPSEWEKDDFDKSIKQICDSLRLTL